MRKAWISAAAIVSTLALATAANATSGARFRATALSFDDSTGKVTVSFDEVGVGQDTVEMELAGLRTETLKCFDPTTHGAGEAQVGRQINPPHVTASGNVDPEEPAVKASITATPPSAAIFVEYHFKAVATTHQHFEATDEPEKAGETFNKNGRIAGSLALELSEPQCGDSALARPTERTVSYSDITLTDLTNGVQATWAGPYEYHWTCGCPEGLAELPIVSVTGEGRLDSDRLFDTDRLLEALPQPR